jgi:hypothetical protein
VAAARGRAALVFLTRAAGNSGGLSGWMRASTAAQPAASRLHPPLTPSVFLRLPPPLESQARTAYVMLWKRATLHLLEISRSFGPRMRERERLAVRPPLLTRLKMATQVFVFSGGLILVFE